MSVIHVVWTVLVGFGGAVIYHWYSNRFVGKLVRKLLEIDAVGADAAVSMEDVHCKMTPALKMALREDGALFEAVKTTDEEPPRYYIPTKKREMLTAKYQSEGTGLVSVILWLCLLVVIGVVFSIVYPPMADYFAGIADSV